MGRALHGIVDVKPAVHHRHFGATARQLRHDHGVIAKLFLEAI